jgi:hypothetical protein
MLLQDRDALCNAFLTDMRWCARYKTFGGIGLAMAEGAAQAMRAPPQQAPERCKATHVRPHLSVDPPVP